MKFSTNWRRCKRVDTYKVKVTRQARAHLQKIKEYIRDILLAPEAANNTIAALRKEIKSLDKMPGRIKLMEDEPWHTIGIHQMQVKNYYVYFWIDEERKLVQVTSVIYVGRDQPKQLRRMKME